MAICLERSADLHVVQLMPLPLTVSCSSKIQTGFTFLVPAHPDSPGQRAVKRACVCVTVAEKGRTSKKRKKRFSVSSSVQWGGQCTKTCIHHTHPFNGPFSGTTRVSRYQKGKTNLDFTEARDNECSGISWAICKSAPCSRQTTTPAPHHSVFYRPDALPAAQPTASKHPPINQKIF